MHGERRPKSRFLVVITILVATVHSRCVAFSHVDADAEPRAGNIQGVHDRLDGENAAVVARSLRLVGGRPSIPLAHYALAGFLRIIVRGAPFDGGTVHFETAAGRRESSEARVETEANVRGEIRALRKAAVEHPPGIELVSSCDPIQHGFEIR